MNVKLDVLSNRYENSNLWNCPLFMRYAYCIQHEHSKKRLIQSTMKLIISFIHYIPFEKIFHLFLLLFFFIRIVMLTHSNILFFYFCRIIVTTPLSPTKIVLWIIYFVRLIRITSNLVSPSPLIIFFVTLVGLFSM